MIKLFLILVLATFVNVSCDTDNNVYTNDKIALNQVKAIEQTNDELVNSRQNAITRAIQNANPAIVGINVTEIKQVVYKNPFFNDPIFRRFFGDDYGNRVEEYKVQGMGSGFIISPDGYILTNHHVAGNASKIVVTMTGGKRYDAEIIGSDMVSDVALLKIEGKNLPYLKLGNSDDLLIGEWAIAFGNPFGLFDLNAKPTVTVGVISNTGINFLHPDEPQNRVYKNMIQTDAAISSGNSGGPLLNALGEVIGMNTIIYSTANSQQGAGSIGIGFSIPINRVKKIVDILKSKVNIDRDFWTGLDVRNIDENLARYLGIKSRDGVVIFGMQNNSPADKAGLKPGDIITAVDGQVVNKIDDFQIYIGDSFVGDKRQLTVTRNDKEMKVTIVLEKYEGTRRGR